MVDLLPQVWTKVTRPFKPRVKNQVTTDYSDNEIIFSKNNVCVHSDTQKHTDSIHNLGYFTISFEKVEASNSGSSDVTLRLSWTSNSLLCSRYRKPPHIHGHRYRHDLTSEELNRKISVESCDSGYHDDLDDVVIKGHYEIIDESSLLLASQTLSGIETHSESISNGNDYDKSVPLPLKDRIYPPGLIPMESFNLISCSFKSESDFQCKFTVDLGYVKSLRLFFNDNNDSGQLVITSIENQYKILHFHRGGLKKLSDVLERWKMFVSATQDENCNDVRCLYKHFKIFCSGMQQTELHPGEKSMSQVTQDYWLDMLNDDGQVEDEMLLRKRIFFGGLHKDIRKFIWPFLLNCYSFNSTYEQRRRIKLELRQQYQDISENRRKLLETSPADNSFKLVEHLIHKDVIRTDRSHPFYAGDDNPNLVLMKRVLLNYVYYDGRSSYMQGMSDLLAPILVEIPDEAEAFWSFVDIMKKKVFVCTPTDSDMEQNLMFLRELIRLMHPRFYSHLESVLDGMDLLFCHRWLLLCFKREFVNDVVLQIWEACWSNYLTDYFHLFICLAVISTYAHDVVEQRLNSDDMLYYFSSLAMSMDGKLILKKARGLVHQFRTLDKIPLSLVALCQRCGSDMWDSKHVPTVVT